MEGGSRPPYDFDLGRQHSNKRSYSQMERSSASPLFVRQNSTPSESHVSPPATHTRLALPPIRSHFPRDGFDFRRPATSSAQNHLQPRNPTMANTVIDLTSDDDSAPSSHRPTPQPSMAAGPATTRLPRYDREIIDLSADPTSPVQTRQAPPRPTSSPEVEFVSERPRSRTGNHPPRVPNLFDGAAFPDDDDDIYVIRGTTRRGVNQTRPQATDAFGAVGRVMEMLRTGPGGTQIQNFLNNMPAPGRAFTSLLGPGLMLDYETVAFNVGADDNENVTLPIPKYDPPPPAPEGFTRNPTEEDIIVCPSCEDELAVGETEEKRQVWVVKACGHVYCGTCMNNRKARQNKSAKGKGRADDPVLPKPFKTCLAEGCSQNLSRPTAVMQIFL